MTARPTPSRTPITQPRALAAVSLCTLLVVASSVAAASDRRLWDETSQLSSRQRNEIEQHLTVAKRRLESPLYVLITDRLRNESATQMAERVFAERALAGSAKSNPVLLLVAVRDNSAGIATGKGNAGIVPEIDAARITRELSEHKLIGNLKVPLLKAITAITEAGEARGIRRRPLSPEDDDLPPQREGEGEGGGDAPPDGLAATSGAPTVPRSRGDAANGTVDVASTGTTEAAEALETSEGVKAGTPTAADGAPHPAGPSRTSRVPIALAVGALFLLALALRRRQTLAATRRAATATAHAPARKPPTSSAAPPPRRPP